MQLTGNAYVGLGFYNLFPDVLHGFYRRICCPYAAKGSHYHAGLHCYDLFLCPYAISWYLCCHDMEGYPFCRLYDTGNCFSSAITVCDKLSRLKAADYFTILLPYLLSGIMMCLLRTNGWYIFLVTLPFVLFVFRDRWKVMIPVHLIILALVLFVKYPCMNVYEIKQADFAESVSIPVQQLACVVARGESLQMSSERPCHTIWIWSR